LRRPFPLYLIDAEATIRVDGVEGPLEAATLLASLAGSAVGMTLVLMGRATWGTALPFGAFLAGGAMGMLFCTVCLR